ncbi:aminopeptidase N [Trueperella pecoris]|uniref:aminopeptidase N n=1 Tax=Trueperella pecoris TaxID=2733571 RepID=UPI00186B9CBD|nr:aminopeptidase N [Trueperella pecoris]QOQ38830.1 aminopeptidase N [Trueperella pecoris]
MTENLKRSEAHRRAEYLELDGYQIDLDVTEAPSSLATFGVVSRIALTSSETAETFLDFIGPEVSEVRVDDAVVHFTFDGARIYLEIPAGKHTIEVTARGTYSTSGEGLHRFRDPVDNETYLYTQFEPADARRVYPNFEQPNLKATFAITITAPRSWVVLSNGAEVSASEAGKNSLGDDVVRHEFATTKRMSTYLTAFIGGPYHEFKDVAEVDGQTIDLGFYCRTSLKDHFDIDDIVTVTKQGLGVLPKVFDYPYPWGKYDSVFVPEYNLGAMENPGCVTFSEDAYVFRGQSTRSQRANRANTILHEMSHMWFGDLMTPVWWDDLWLKESFAEFMGAWAMVAATQYSEGWENFAGSRVAWALRNDQYPTTHPIVADIVDLEAADQAFDGITYAKGAAVLRQLVAWVGENDFFAGAAKLFKDRAFANATLHDLLDALGEVSGKDVVSWAKQWLESAGVSTVAVERRPEGVQLRQVGTEPLTGLSITRPHLLKVSGWRIEDGVLNRVASVDVELTQTQLVEWEAIGGEGIDLILPNDEALSYIKIAFDERSLQAAMAHELADPLARSVVSSALWEMVRDGLLSAADFADFVVRSGEGTGSGLLSSRVMNAVAALRTFTPIQTRIESLSSFFDAAATKRASEDADVRLIWTRAVARAGELLVDRDDDVVELLAQTTDQDLRWMLLTARAATGSLGTDDLDAELARTGTAADVVAYLEATASLPGASADALAKVVAGGLSNDHVQALINGLRQPLRAGETAAAVGDYFARLEDIWTTHSQEIAERIIYGLYPMSDLDSASPQRNAQVLAADEWLATHEQAPASLRKIILDCRHEHLRMLRAQATRW